MQYTFVTQINILLTEQLSGRHFASIFGKFEQLILLLGMIDSLCKNLARYRLIT